MTRESASGFRPFSPEEEAAALSALDDATIGINAEGTISFWNKGAEKLLGHSAAEMLGTSYARLIPEGVRKEEVRQIEKALSGEGLVRLETRRLAKDGRLVGVSLSLSPVRSVSGEVFAVVETARASSSAMVPVGQMLRLNLLYKSLREINQATFALSNEADLYQRVCDILVGTGGFEMVWLGLIDFKTGKVDPVSRCGDKTGYVGKITVYVDERPEGLGPTGRAIRAGRTYVCNDFLTNPQTLPWREAASEAGFAASTVIPIRKGRVICGSINVYSGEAGYFQERELALLEAVAEEISFGLDKLALEDARRKAEQALLMSEERFREIAENIREVFWVTDSQTDELLYVSPAYEKIWGHTCASLLADNNAWKQSIHPEDRLRVVDAASQKTTSGGYDATYRIIRADGRIRWIHDRAFPVRDKAGRLIRIVGTAEDITERQLLEEEFRQAQKMEAIGTLAGGIAHDFNNILAAIIGFSELARKRAEWDRVTADYLDSVLQGANRAKTLVSQILSFSRRRPEQELHPLMLDQAVAEPLKLLRASIPSSVEFDVDLPGNLPPVLADATQVHQIVMNLGTNAAHAMRGKQGRLAVRLESVSVGEAAGETPPGVKPGAYVRLTVADNGSGMNEATTARIYEPYFTTKPAGEGTGLGLPVVHAIMKDYKGAIVLRTKVGEGTTFDLYFPALAAPAPAAVVPQNQKLPAGRGEKILIVDDEVPIATLGEVMLSDLGYTSESTTSARKALEIVRANAAKYDLVITDLTMPDMTGDELARRFREIRPDLPLILATGYNATLSKEQLRELGFRTVLSKPFTFQTLSEAVQRTLSGEARI